MSLREGGVGERPRLREIAGDHGGLPPRLRPHSPSHIDRDARGSGLNLVAALGRASHSHVDWNVDGAGEGAAFVADGPLKVPDPSLGVIGRERYGRTRFGVQPSGTTWLVMPSQPR